MRNILKSSVAPLLILIVTGFTAYDKHMALEQERAARANIEKHLTKMNESREALQASYDDLRQKANLSRYYALLARALRCSHEPSIALVETVYKALEQENECGFQPDDIMSLILIESCFNPRAQSRAGARGLTQIMPDTARQYGIDDPNRLWEVDLNITLGVRILNDYAKMYKCNKRLGLLAYNRGPAKVSQVLRNGQDPSNGYDDAVIQFGF